VGVVCGSNWANDVIAELTRAGGRVMIVNQADECELLDLLIVIADASDSETHRRAARWARQHNIAALHGGLSATEIVVGPLFRPGRGACWNCAQFRCIANQPHAAAAHSLDENCAALAGPSQRHSGLLCKIAASVLTLEAFKAVLLKSDSLLSRLWVFSPFSLTTSTHLVVPLPSCNVCEGARAVDRQALFALDLDAVRNATSLDTGFPGWIDPRTGVIAAAWFENDIEDADQGPYFVSAQLSSYSNSRFVPVPGDRCGGKGIHRVDAIRSGIGEALERYSAARLDKDRIRHASGAQLSGDVLSPAAIGLYSSRQYDTAGFPFLPFDPQEAYHWIEGVWLPSRKPVWVPAELTYVLPNSLGDRLSQTTTSGLALGSDFDAASRRAILELVERDATMMTWLCRLPAHSIILDRCDDGLNAILHGLKALNVDVEFDLLDVGIDIPTVLACGFGDGERWPGFCVGSAAHASASAALRAAALEMASTADGLRRTSAQGIEIEKMRSDRFTDHALYYVTPERAGAAAFLRTGSTIKYSALPELSDLDAAQLGAKLAKLGIRVAIVDVTSPDIALSGLRVVRALTDGLLPIYCGHGYERGGSRRLKDRLAAINPDPHPFC
jgi:ribosomal protein S12 methylthiotransferase accessory factor